MLLLKTKSLLEVNQLIKENLNIKQTIININVKDASNYILAEDIYSKEAIPAFNKSLVDGYSLLVKDTKGATNTMPAILSIIEGSTIGTSNNAFLNTAQAQQVSTGSMIPSNCDGVIMLEDVELIKDTNELLVNKSLSHNENITLVGEDISLNECLFKEGTMLDERHLATLLSLGIKNIKVYERLQALILSSGDELVTSSTSKLSLGQVRDVNTIIIKEALTKSNIDVIEMFLIKDDYKTYLDILSNTKANLIITSAGSSKGKADYTYDIFKTLTNNVLVHGIALKPGKPTILAASKDKLYIGLPGNPVAAYLVLKQTLLKILDDYYNRKNKVTEAYLKVNVNGDHGKDSIILIKLEESNQKLYAIPKYYKSSQLLNLALVDGYIIIPYNKEGYKINELVKVVHF